MSEIDKALPNEVRKEINIPGVEEIQVELEKEAAQETKGPVEVQQNEDGSVDVNFDPSAVNVEGTEGHFANLAELLPDDVLDPLGSQMYENYQDYKASRKDWEKTYTSGLELLGFNYDDRTEPFRGASGATHPVLAEAVTQFQALAYKELLPAQGPVRTQIVGMPTSEKEAQSQRVKEFMNYQILEVMEEFDPDMDQLLFYLPLSGSTFKKVYFDETKQRAVAQFVPAQDLEKGAKWWGSSDESSDEEFCSNPGMQRVAQQKKPWLPNGKKDPYYSLESTALRHRDTGIFESAFLTEEENNYISEFTQDVHVYEARKGPLKDCSSSVVIFTKK